MTLPRAAFERAVRRLDGEAARGLVADLLGARGYRTAVDGASVTATREGDRPGASMRVLVVDRVGTLATAGLDPDADHVVLTGGPVLEAVWSVTAGAGNPTGADRPTVLGTGTLYEWYAYAVDAETRGTLADEYLDATGPSVLGRGAAALAGAVGGVTASLVRLPAPSRRVMGVVLAVLVLVVAATTAAGPAGLLASTGGTAGGDGSPTPALTPVPATPSPAPSGSGDGFALPEACPPAPVGAHPAALRPGVIRTASADGLEGWRLLVKQNITEYEFDPNDQQLGLVPEVRHVGVFETPSGARLRLGLDRWQSPARAETAIARGGAWSIGFPWGAYGVWVEWHSDGERSEVSARELFAAVRTPEGVRLSGACVSELLAADAPPTDATA